MAIINILPNTSKTVTLDRGFTDVLKFIAAIMVAMGHYSGHALDYVENPVLRFFVMNGGSIGVAVFFFLLGYGLMMSELKSHHGFLAFIKRRLMKVYLPVLLVSAIWGVVIWPDGTGMEHLPAYFYLVFWGFSDGILWFVRVIMVMYIIFYGYSVIRSNKHWRLAYLAASTAIVYTIICFWLESWCAISVPIFTLGVMLAEYNDYVWRITHGWQLFMWLLLITIFWGILYMHFGNLYAHALINYYVITAVITICSYKRIAVIVPDWVGGVSYDIYLTHHKVINYLCPIYGYIQFHHFFVGAAITAVASYSLRKLMKC